MSVVKTSCGVLSVCDMAVFIKDYYVSVAVKRFGDKDHPSV